MDVPDSTIQKQKRSLKSLAFLRYIRTNVDQFEGLMVNQSKDFRPILIDAANRK